MKMESLLGPAVQQKHVKEHRIINEKLIIKHRIIYSSQGTN